MENILKAIAVVVLSGLLGMYLDYKKKLSPCLAWNLGVYTGIIVAALAMGRVK